VHGNPADQAGQGEDPVPGVIVGMHLAESRDAFNPPGGGGRGKSRGSFLIHQQTESLKPAIDMRREVPPLPSR